MQVMDQFIMSQLTINKIDKITQNQHQYKMYQQLQQNMHIQQLKKEAL